MQVTDKQAQPCWLLIFPLILEEVSAGSRPLGQEQTHPSSEQPMDLRPSLEHHLNTLLQAQTFPNSHLGPCILQNASAAPSGPARGLAHRQHHWNENCTTRENNIDIDKPTQLPRFGTCTPQAADPLLSALMHRTSSSTAKLMWLQGSEEHAIVMKWFHKHCRSHT